MAGARSFGPTYLKRTVRRNSIRRGLFGGSRFWIAVFAGLRIAAWAGKITKRGEAPVRFSESLAQGESLVIRHLGAGAAANDTAT